MHNASLNLAGAEALQAFLVRTCNPDINADKKLNLQPSMATEIELKVHAAIKPPETEILLHQQKPASSGSNIRRN